MHDLYKFENGSDREMKRMKCLLHPLKQADLSSRFRSLRLKKEDDVNSPDADHPFLEVLPFLEFIPRFEVFLEILMDGAVNRAGVFQLD